MARIDILVNNAAVNVIASHFDYDPEVWDWVVQVNLSGPWYLCRRVLPVMRDGGRGGVVVNVSIVRARRRRKWSRESLRHHQRRSERSDAVRCP